MALRDITIQKKTTNHIRITSDEDDIKRLEVELTKTSGEEKNSYQKLLSQILERRELNANKVTKLPLNEAQKTSYSKKRSRADTPPRSPKSNPSIDTQLKTASNPSASEIKQDVEQGTKVPKPPVRVASDSQVEVRLSRGSKRVRKPPQDKAATDETLSAMNNDKLKLKNIIEASRNLVGTYSPKILKDIVQNNIDEKKQNSSPSLNTPHNDSTSLLSSSDMDLFSILNKKIEELQNNLQEQSKQVENLNSELDTTKKKLVEKSKDVTIVELKYQTQVETLNSKISSLEKSLSEKSETVENLKIHLKNSKADNNKDLNDKVTNLTKKVDMLEDILKEKR